jgi:hypothetical protein
MTAASKIKPDTPLYDRDFVLWTEEQAKLLRAGRFDRVDLANLVEEVESLGRSDKRALRTELRRLATHLLKWIYQPAKRTVSWSITISDARSKIDAILIDSPSLRPIADTLFAETYGPARNDALRQTGLEKRSLPTEPPFTLDQVLDDDFWPD